MGWEGRPREANCTACNDVGVFRQMNSDKTPQQHGYETTHWCHCKAGDLARLDWERMLAEQRERQNKRMGKDGH